MPLTEMEKSKYVSNALKAKWLSMVLELSLGLWQDIHILEVYRKMEMEKQNFCKMIPRF